MDSGELARVKRLIKNELQGSGCLLGYRAMWRRITTKYKVAVSRSTVRQILAYIDPVASLRRQTHRLQRRRYVVKGPNEAWHADGNDKLLPYGFAIHGCIDGYSRRIMWLKVGTTNKNPRVIASLFLKTVESVGGCPRLLRSDCGTENSVIAYVQPFLRRNHTDTRSGINSFRYGKSTSNQRIEALWGQVGKSCTYWWISFFKGMMYHDLYSNASEIQLNCLRFCFMHLLQRDLDQFMWEWNTHRIRRDRGSNTVGGVPNVLYFTPTSSGTPDMKCPVEAFDLQFLHQQSCVQDLDPPVGSDFLQIAVDYMIHNNVTLPVSVREAVMLYVDLVHLFENILAP